MLQEFKKFALRGNVLDMAIGVIIGGAFGKIISSVVSDLFMPLLSLLTSRVDFTSLKLVLREGVMDGETVVSQEVAVTYGAFLQNVLDFLLIAFCIFLFVRAINKLKEKNTPKQEPVAPAGPTEVELLGEIRDLLKKD